MAPIVAFARTVATMRLGTWIAGDWMLVTVRNGVARPHTVAYAPCGRNAVGPVRKHDAVALIGPRGWPDAALLRASASGVCT